MTEASTTTIPTPIYLINLEEDSIDIATNKALKRLAVIYCMLQPEKSVNDFIELVFKPLSESTHTNPASIDYTAYTKHSVQTIRGLMTCLATCCAHCIHATIADEEGVPLRAWNQIASATYQLGKLEGLLMVEPAIGHIISSRATTARMKRDDPLVDVRKFARGLVEKTLYKNKNQAAIAIKAEVLTKATELKARLTETGAIKTISNWIADCEFAEKK